MSHEAPDPGCHPRLLGSGPLGAVSQCTECGQIHLTLAYLTLRLQPDAFRELTGMMAMALQQLPSPPLAAPLHAAVPLH